MLTNASSVTGYRSIWAVVDTSVVFREKLFGVLARRAIISATTAILAIFTTIYRKFNMRRIFHNSLEHPKRESTYCPPMQEEHLVGASVQVTHLSSHSIKRS